MTAKAKKNFTKYVSEEVEEQETPAQRQAAIETLKSQLANAFSNNLEPQKFFALAEQCYQLNLFDDHCSALRHAAAQGHLEAAYLFASIELTEKKNCDFLQEHCKRVDADPRCLTLLSQTMENWECGLEFDPAVCFALVNRAIARTSMLVRISNTRVWRHAFFTASCERARLILDHGFEATEEKSPWKIARDTLAPFARISSIHAVYGLKNLEKMDLHILLGRISDKAMEIDNALDHYRSALTIAKKMDEPIFFLQARIATLTKDVDEAMELLPGAIAWLDDLGVGKNDEEMPDLVARFAQFFPLEAVQRQQLSLPQSLPESTNLLPLLTASSFALNFPPITTLSPGWLKRTGDDDIFPPSKYPNLDYE